MANQPSETDLIKEILSVLINSGSELSVDDTQAALEALQTLVEPIDNANSE
jgi:hypothetical protein